MMIRVSFLFPIFLIIILFFAFSCPTEQSSVTRYYSDWADDQYFFQYNITPIGSITYINNSSLEVTKSVQGVFPELDYDTDTRFICAKYNVTFADTDFAVTLFVKYFAAENRYKLEYKTSTTRIYFCVPVEGYERESLGYSYGRDIADSDTTITCDNSGNLSTIVINTNLDSGFDFSGYTESPWNERQERVKSLSLSLTFTRTDYIVKNTTSAFGIDYLRFYDTNSIIKNVPLPLANDIFSNPEDNLDDLVNYLVQDQTDAGVKLKIINDWIADNIYYDFDSYNAFTIRMEDNLPYTILKNRHCVCQGFSRLYIKMCEMAGISVQYIRGKSRDKGEPLGSGDYGGGHAWNMVQINNQFYIIDVTSNQTGEYLDGVNTDMPFYNIMFLVKPEIAKYRRWPSFNQWQALTVPMNDLEFNASPYDYGQITYTKEYCYFNNLQFEEPVEDVIPINGTAREFEVTTALNCELLLNTYRYDAAADDWVKANSWGLLNYLGGNRFSVSLFPAENGEQMFYLYKKDVFFNDATIDGYKSVAAFRCSTVSSYTGDHPFPKQYSNCIKYQAKITEPLCGDLQAGSTVNFSVTVSGVEDGGIWYYLTDDPQTGDPYTFITHTMSKLGDTYSGSYKIPAEARVVHLGFKLPSKTSYYTFLCYYANGTGGSFKSSQQSTVPVVISDDITEHLLKNEPDMVH